MKRIPLTVITVAYNNLEGLRHTAETVFAQTAQDFEFIVVDGGSSDGTREWLEANDAQIDWWCSEPDGGIFPGMNKGITHAHGDYCLFLNSGDCFYDNTVVAKVLPLLDGKDFYMGHQQNVGVNRRKLYAPKRMMFGFIITTALYHQATFIRTDLLRVRPYDTRYTLTADWKQMMEEYCIHNASYQQLPFFVALYDTTGVSHQKEHAQRYEEEKLRMYSEFFAPRLVDEFRGYDRFDRKVRRALNLENHVQRDLKILRNVLKTLPVDLWRLLRG